MSAPDELSPPGPRWPWLDRWFEPPWRALLTWVGLAGLSGWALGHGADDGIEGMVSFLSHQMERVLPTPLQREMWEIAVINNVLLLLSWFEPLALRLDLLRGLAWLGLRCGTYVVTLVVCSRFTSKGEAVLLAFALCSVLPALVLRGWRSRPWMAVIAWMLAGAFLYLGHLIEYLSWSISRERVWVFMLVLSFPYAAVLLYGTRRLPR